MHVVIHEEVEHLLAMGCVRGQMHGATAVIVGIESGSFYIANDVDSNTMPWKLHRR